jgi:adenylylsulfate kinase-like enzyme
LRSLVDALSRFIVTTIADKSYTEIQASLSTETCQNADAQNQYKQADERERSNMTEEQNPYKLPLNPELTLFSEKPEESANYQYRFDDSR